MVSLTKWGKRRVFVTCAANECIETPIGLPPYFGTGSVEMCFIIASILRLLEDILYLSRDTDEEGKG